MRSVGYGLHRGARGGGGEMDSQVGHLANQRWSPAPRRWGGTVSRELMERGAQK